MPLQPEFSIQRVCPHHPIDAVETLQGVALAGFMQTFGANYPQADVDDYCERRLSLAAIQQELMDEKAYFYLIHAQIKGKMTCVGYIKYLVPSSLYAAHLPNTFVDKYTNRGCLERMYILQPYQGLGLAAVAMQYVLSQLRASHQVDGVYLSVWSENHRAQRFYQRFGFQTIGSFGYPVGDTVDLELLFGLPLD